MRDAYLNGTLKGSSDKNNGEVLPEGYFTSAKSLAERRVTLAVTLAGYRLRDYLQKVFANF